MPTRSHIDALKFGTVMFLAAAALWAQNPAPKFEPLSDPMLDRLHRAELASTLTRDGVNPFYLKIDVQLYDAKGKPSEKGSIEEWWAGESTDKTVFTTPSYTGTQVRKGDVIFSSASSPIPPNLLTLLLDQVIRPLPSQAEIEASKASMKIVKFGSVPLECLALRLHSDPTGVSPEYCFDPGKDSLRAVFQYGARLILRNGVGQFQNQEVPIDVTVRMGSAKVATGHISALMSRAVTAEEVSTDGLTQEIVTSSPLAAAEKLILHPEPIYPEPAKREHLSGIVVLQALIGTDGHIQELRLVSSPSSTLTDAAEAAVKKWIYTPYRVDGVPQAAETMITVSFSFGAA